MKDVQVILLMIATNITALLRAPPDDISPKAMTWHDSEDQVIVRFGSLASETEFRVFISHHLADPIRFALIGLCAEKEIAWNLFCPDEQLSEEREDPKQETDKAESELADPPPGSTKH